MKYPKIPGMLFGSTKDLPLENRIFNAITLCSGIAGTFSCMSDYLLNLGSNIVYFTAAAAILSFILHAFGRRPGTYRKLFGPFLVLGIGGIIYSWHVGGGLRGTSLIILVVLAAVVPAMMKGWQRNIALGLVLATGIALYAIESAHPDLPRQLETAQQQLSDIFFTALFFSTSLGVLVGIIARNYRQEQAKVEEKNRQLEQALEEVKTLRGIVPICASCKKIRDDQGYWNHLESFIASHTDATFSHGICPECAAKLYPEIYKK